MYYSTIKKYDIADGLGVRVTLFVSGCTNQCPGCFQPETWDFHYGKPYTEETREEVLAAMDHDYIRGLTFLGGEPFELVNQGPLADLAQEARRRYPGKDIWSYTGFVYDRDLVPGGKRWGADTSRLLSQLDILVDGPFIEEKKNLMLFFRGSENQRILDMPATLREGRVILSELNRSR